MSLFKTPVAAAAMGPQLPQQDLNLKLICKDCQDPIPNVVEDFREGILVCGTCGLVLSHRVIDTRSEWRNFNNDDDKPDQSRVGAAADDILGGQMDSTTIGAGGSRGLAVSLSKAHGKVVDQATERKLLARFREIQAMCERIGLSKLVVDSAKQLYKRVEDDKLLKSRNPEAIIAAVIYIACREQGVSRSFKEVCALTKVPKKEIGRCFKQLQPHFEKPIAEISMDAYVSRFASTLSLRPDVHMGCVAVAKKVMELGVLTGKSPISLVCASMFFGCIIYGQNISAKMIAENAGCSESAVRNSYRYIYAAKEKVVEGLRIPSSLDQLPQV